MNTKLNGIAAAVLALCCGAANASYIITTSPGLMTNVPNVCTVTFDSASTCGATYTANDGFSNHVITGANVPGQYARPANDPTAYVTVGGNLGQPIVITLAAPATYFGFYAGSVDSYNAVTFSGSSAPLTLSGDAINQAMNGMNANQTTNAYFNIFTSFAFTTITLSSSSAAFETDNHSFGVASIPEPTSIALLGVGLLGLAVGSRRRRAAK